MGTNVIHLADWAVPSYRRPRATPAPGAAAHERGWAALARQRAAQRQLANPATGHGPAPVAGQPGLSLVPPTARAQAPAQAPVPRPVMPPPALRVTHVVDARQPAGTSGRLRISGRLVDVCAELDRLAAAAEAQTALPRRA